MSELRAVLADAGHRDVRTHLQSGNVVLTSSAKPATLERLLEQQIEAGLGLRTQVFVRTRDELARVVERNPFRDVADNGSRLLVSFLDAAPRRAVVRELKELDVEPEAFAFDGRVLYSWHPRGFQASKLRRLLAEERLGVAATGRNWNTVTRLLELADA